MSVMLALVTVYTATWTSRPWCDEIVITDAAVNFLRTGVWQSNVWPCCYNPLHLLVAAFAVVLCGASHLTVVAVGCLEAWLASVVILRAMRRRAILKDTLSEILFVVLFWSGWWFSSQIVNGRPDMMTLLALAWLLDELFPPAGKVWRRGQVLLRSAILMAISTYTIPFCVLLSAFPFLSRDHRKDAFWRTFYLGLGFAVGGLLVVGFYAYNRELVRFVGFLTFFNTITGECTQPLLARLRDGYLHDRQALVMLAALALCAPFAKPFRTRRFWGWMALVALIPAIMVFCGRFQPYYGWLFYVPCIILATAVADHTHTALSVLLTISALGAGSYHMMCNHTASQDRLQHEAATAAFVADNAHLLKEGETVLVAADIMEDTAFYYPLLKRKVDLWFRGKSTLEAPSDREKFEVGLSMFLKNPKTRDKILANVMRFQETTPQLPTRALVIFPSPQRRAEVQPILEHRGFHVTDIVADQGFSLCRMEP